MKHLRISGVALALLTLTSQAYAGKLTAWVIDATAEKPYFDQLSAAFDAKFKASDVTLTVVPVPNYTEAIQAASVAGRLPDVILVDGPNMASMAWAGTIQPIDKLVDHALLRDVLPAVLAEGTYGPTGALYYVSAYDSTVILWGNRKMLEAAGVRIPTSPKDAWTRAEMRDALTKLSKAPGVKWPIDLKLSYGAGEWGAYGFLPFISSNGGDLIDRKTWAADGTMNSAGNVDVLTELQDWYKKGWVVPASAGDNQFYGEKTAALSWVGNWMWPPHSQGLGGDLVWIPAPKFGAAGVKSSNGGWGWAVPKSTTNLTDVKTFLDFIMSDEQVGLYADVTGFAPSRESAIPFSKKFGTAGPQELFTEQGKCCAIVRPVHPAYPSITLNWGRALQNILSDGAADVKTELDAAAKAVDQDIADNQGYPPFNGK